MEPSNKEGKKNPKAEFTERTTRLLVAFSDGVFKLLGEQDILAKKLNDLQKVLKKSIRYKPPAGLAKEIQDYFVRAKLEKIFLITEKTELKQIIIDLTLSLKKMIGSSGGYSDSMDNHIGKIQKTDSISEIKAIKDRLIVELRAIKHETTELNKELEAYRKSTQELKLRLEQLESDALIDPLTNSYNRNAFNMKIRQTLNEFNRHKDPMALMFIDIDHFKKFNDNYGHTIGDRVLESVASSIESSIRNSDSLYRFGGEEFVVLLHKCDETQSQRVAEKVRMQVEKDYYIDGDRQLKVTISVGVANFKEGESMDQLVDRADQAMYASKNGGRNRVTLAP